MAVLASFPDSLSFSGNMKPFVVSASAATLFVLKKNGIEILQEVYYPDNSGNFTVDVQEVIHSGLEIAIPTGNMFYQQKAAANFSVYLDGNLQYNFRCVKSGIEGSPAIAGLSFFKANFLTWQPQVMTVKYDDIQYLTYYTTENNCHIRLKFYYYQSNAISTQETTIYTMNAGQVYSLNMKYSHLRSFISPQTQKPVAIDVWVESAANVRLSNIHRYQLTDAYDRFDDLFLFENSLGGVDVIRFDGMLEAKDEHNILKAIFDKEKKEYDIEFSRIYSKNTGYLDTESKRRWALEFFSSVNRYHIVDGIIKRIVVSKFDTKNIKGELNDFSFDYYYSLDDKNEKYSRLTELPALEVDELTEAPVWVVIVPPSNPYSYNASFSKSFNSFNSAIGN